MGSYLEHVTGDDPGKRDRLMKGLDGFLERARDRELFDLPPNKENEKDTPDTAAAPTVSTPPPVLDAPLPGWRPHRLDNGNWGSIYLGDTSILPSELVGAHVTSARSLLAKDALTARRFERGHAAVSCSSVETRA